MLTRSALDTATPAQEEISAPGVRITDEADLEERLLALCAGASSEAADDDGLATIGDELLRARGSYDEIRELDQALFGQEFEA